MDNTRSNNKASVANRKRGRGLQSDRKFHVPRLRRSFNYKSHTDNRNYTKFGHIVSIGLLFASPVYAETTISNPQSSTQSTIVNQGFQQISGSFPTHRYSNGIQCQTPTLSFNPFITKGEYYNTPRSTVQKTNIYNQAKDSETGQLTNPGEILYIAEQERLDQINHNFSYGATISIQVPLGKRFDDECLKAAQTYRKYQEFLLDAKRLEVNLNRAKLCSTMLKEGIKFVGEDAVSCRNIVLTTIPNQVIPHTHKIKKPPQNKGG